MPSRSMFLAAAAKQAMANFRNVKMTAPVELKAAATVEDGQSPALPTFTINAYSGDSMQLTMSFYPVVIDLDGLASKDQIPVLADHDTDVESIVGQSTSVVIDAAGVTIAGTIMADDASAGKIIALAKNGFLWQASVGASVEAREFIESGATAIVNGKTFNGPMVIARKSTLREVSFVSVGADETTTVAIAASFGDAMKFEEWLKAQGISVDTLTDAGKATLQASFDVQSTEPVKQAKVPADDLTEHRKLRAAESRRVGAITTICAGNADIEAKAIEEGWTVEKTELQILRTSRTAPAVGGTNKQAVSAAVITASLCLTAGISAKSIESQVPASEREQVMNAATSSAMRGYSIHALMDETIRASGSHYSGSRKSNDFIRAAFQADVNLKAGGFSTVSLSGVLSNVANKALIASYDAVEVTWKSFAAVRSHADFKLSSRYRLDAQGAFKKIGPDGELKHVGLTDSSFTNQLGTYGAIIALTRQMMINDDLNAFTEIPLMLGRLAAVRVEEEVYKLLLSNPSSFFGSGNKNILTGSGNVLAIEGLGAAEGLFRSAVDSNGKPVLVSPKVLVTGTALSIVAQQLFRDTTLIAVGSGTTKAVTTNANPFAAKYPPVVSPYVDNTAITDQDGFAITGQSATKYYLFADPAVRAAIAVAFLNGQQTPTIESAETDFATLGMQWRGYEDFGVGMEDPKAAVMVTGV